MLFRVLAIATMALAACGSLRGPRDASTDGGDDGPGSDGSDDTLADDGASLDADDGGPRDADDGGVADAARDTFGGAGPDGAVVSGLGPHCTGCTRTPIGEPIWEPKGAVVMVGRVGSATSGLGELASWLGGYSAPNHRLFTREFMIGPATGHSGPYDDEAFAMASATRVVMKQNLTVNEFSAPLGVVLVVNVVPGPNAPQGSSFDYGAGPVIPNARFPIRVAGTILREGAPYELFDSGYPGYDRFRPAISGDGPSHLFFMLAENSSFVPGVPAAGRYEFRIRALDTGGTGAGWDMRVPFSVGP